MSTPEEQRERELSDALRRTLRESESIDYVTASRLSAARKRAMATAGHGASRWQRAAMSGALLAALLIAVFAPWRNLTPDAPAVSADTAHLESLDVLGDEMEPEFYRDLDLYQWLAQDGGEHA